VIEYIEDEDDEYEAVYIYSSKTAAWICKESRWGEGIEAAFVISPSVFLNSCLHIIGFSSWNPQILAMDMEGKTRRKIPIPTRVVDSIHQAQGHLCVYYW
jgi:hypothetical protein